MSGTDAAGFWSYAHEDDRADQGAILRLATRIGDEYSLITGRELRLFTDRKDIKWGQEWRERIREALVQTTFFIPVLSPRYFKRDECRAELLEFAAHAKSLGVADLIMPILYVPVSGLTADNPDEAVALVARMQYEDWTELRIRDEASESHREAVRALVQRLADIGSSVADRQLSAERDIVADGDPEPGLAEILREIEILLPEWRDAVQTDPILDAQTAATFAAFDEKRRKLSRRQAGARLALTHRQAAEMLPLVERELTLAETYSSRTISLSPLVLQAIRAVLRHRELLPSLADFEAAVEEAVERAEIRQGGIPVEEWARKRSHESHAMGTLESLWRQSKERRIEGNTIVLQWAEQLSALHEDEPYERQLIESQGAS